MLMVWENFHAFNGDISWMFVSKIITIRSQWPIAMSKDGGSIPEEMLPNILK
jgi:hypothetical protein